MAFRWDINARRYRDAESGKFISEAKVRAARQDIIDRSTVLVDALSAQLDAGEIDVETWTLRMREVIKTTTIAQYVLGRGGRNVMKASDWGRIGYRLREQYGFLQRFAEQVDVGQLSPAQIADRARMYVDGTWSVFDRGKGAAWDIRLPAHPGDGSTRCITDPSARVWTDQGPIAITDVRVGMMVLTHEGRFRPVTATMNHEVIDKTNHLIRVEGGEPFSLTGDHSVLTPDGWMPFDDAIARSLPLLAMTEVSHEDEEMSRLWNADRSTSNEMLVLCEQDQGQESVERSGSAGTHDGFDDCRREDEADSVRGSLAGIELDCQDGRAAMDLVLGRGSQADDLPLSVAMDSSSRADSCRPSHPSHQWRLHGRPNREPAVSSETRAQQASRQRAVAATACEAGRYADWEDGGTVRALRSGVSGEDQGEAESVLLARVPDRIDADDSNLRSLQGGVHRWVGSWQTPEVLQSIVLGQFTTAFDLEVADDHSFVVEGAVVHNCRSRCRCSWDIRRNDEDHVIEARWKLDPGAEHCEDCVRNAQTWDPLIFAIVSYPDDIDPDTGIYTPAA